jgi:hypothetical protein
MGTHQWIALPNDMVFHRSEDALLVMLQVATFSASLLAELVTTPLHRGTMYDVMFLRLVV